ncbi:Os07g0656501 [Oryza sativa Japonica Group]|uniref:Os07g0656501 protein n=2 Tax=Oryza TaxID=4527 RepID=A0A0P0X9Y5_ORYSJ|nr:Os07g0656501 [Oryza sativa Japonica Group]
MELKTFRYAAVPTLPLSGGKLKTVMASFFSSAEKERSDSNQHRPKAMHAVSPLQAYSQLPVCIPSRAGAAVDSSPDGQSPDVYLFYHFNSCLMPPCVLDTERPTARF